MKPHVITTTKKGKDAITSFGLCKLHIAILTVAMQKPSPPVHVVMREVRIIRDVAFTPESLSKDIAELSRRGYLTVHQ